MSTTSQKSKLLSILLLTGGCQGDPATAPVTLGSASLAHVVQEVPLRAAPNAWPKKSDDSLWASIARSDSSAVVGLKGPAASRGIWRATILISSSEHAGALEALGNVPGVRIVSRLDPMPAVVVRFSSKGALQQLRRLPFVDYIEPTGWIEPHLFDDSGCGSSGQFTESQHSTPEGDVVGWSYDYWHHDVEEAWERSSGDNVRVAILDTGLDDSNTQFSTFFASGLSTDRVLTKNWSEAASSNAPAPWWDECGHGTRVAGVIGAPRDGRDVAGIAYKADILAMRVGSDVVNWFNEVDVYHGLTYAVGTWTAKVVEMAFGASNYSYLISDYISYTYHRPGGPVYVAAIGNGGVPNASFPAEMDEVIGVVAMNSDGSRNSNSSWGPDAEVAGFVPVPATGAISKGDAAFTRLSLTSGASATIAGIAALIYGVHPSWTNEQVRTRLKQAGSHPNERNWQNGYGYVNAWLAVGGTTWLVMSGRECATYADSFITVSVNVNGDGPFHVRWDTGEEWTNTINVTPAPSGEYRYVTVEVTDMLSGRVYSGIKAIYTTTELVDYCE